MSRVMSIRELSANTSRGLALAEVEDLILTKHGKPWLRVTRDGVEDGEARRQAAIKRLTELMDEGIPLGGPATYEERTGR